MDHHRSAGHFVIGFFRTFAFQITKNNNTQGLSPLYYYYKLLKQNL